MTTSSVSFNDETQPGLSSVWSWWCESGRAAVGQTEVSPNGKALDVTTLTGQDWWRKPGHDACNAPAFVRSFDAAHLSKDFTVSVTVSGDWKQTFDQGCVFLHVTPKTGPTRWVKAGIEREDDVDWIGAVVTSQYADWAIASPSSPEAAQLSSKPIRFTLSRLGHKLLIRAEDSSNPLLFRRDVNGFFDGFEAAEVRVGVMACQPGKDRAAVKCRFDDFAFAFA